MLLQEAHITNLNSVTKIPWNFLHWVGEGERKHRGKKRKKKHFGVEASWSNLTLQARFHTLNVKDFAESVIKQYPFSFYLVRHKTSVLLAAVSQTHSKSSDTSSLQTAFAVLTSSITGQLLNPGSL